MRSKSDERGKVISATEASRTFSVILDRVERGDSFLIERHGKKIGLLGPPPLTGTRASECLERLRGREAVLLDDRFGEDLLAVIAGEPSEERPWGS